MNGMDGKPDVLELARAQLDFSALNAGAPSVKQVLFKAQTIVPISAHPPLTRFAAPAALAVACCALLLLPWIPQRTVLSVVEFQFDSRFTPGEAQQLIDTAVRGLVSTSALPGAEFIPRSDGRGQLTLRATSLVLHGADLHNALDEALHSSAGATPPIYFSLPVADAVYAERRSPAMLLLDKLRPHGESAFPAYYPAAKLAADTLAGEQVYRQELAAYLQQRGYRLTGFAFSGNGALLPPGCQFTVNAWPEPIAIGVRRYFQLTPYQRQELNGHVLDWLKQMNLREAGLRLAAEPTLEHPVVCEVVDRQGRPDLLLTSRLNAAVQQQPDVNPADVNSIDSAISQAAAEALPGIERRVDFERAGTPEHWLFKVRITMQGRQELDAAVADPVDDSAVKEQF
jgi:hypothetical protein